MQVEAVVCAGCSCLCDDITVTLEAGRITQAKNACASGMSWFLEQGKPGEFPVAKIEGRAVTMEEGIEAAAALLSRARYPILYGLSGADCEVQRQGVALAEALGGSIDGGLELNGTSMQSFGEATCTLGEVKNRADLVIFWGVQPGKTHPRHMERYSVFPRGRLVPTGRESRTIVAVGAHPFEIFEGADFCLTVRAEETFETLWALRALVQGRDLSADATASQGLANPVFVELADRMRNCGFGVLFFGPELTEGVDGEMNLSALTLLSRDLNQMTKFSVIPMHAAWNAAGMESVMTWQSGFPSAVNFSRGYPRFNAGEFSLRAALQRGEADAVLSVAADSAAVLAGARPTGAPLIAMDYRESETTGAAQVSFRMAAPGVTAEGTAYRMDHVPLYLKKLLPCLYPSGEEILGRLLARVKEVWG